MATPLVDQQPVSLPPAAKIIAVFGASWCQPGSELYAESERLGKAIATAGFKLVNGGYGGTMEGTAKGASEANAASSKSERVEIEGVVVSQLFKARSGGNQYLTTTTDTPTLLDRIQRMIQECSYFVIMPGTLGTLAELAVVWNVAALAPLGDYTPARIYAYRKPWEAACAGIVQSLNIPASHADVIRFVDSAEEVVGFIEADFKARLDGKVLAPTASAAGWPAPTSLSSGAAAMPSASAPETCG